MTPCSDVIGYQREDTGQYSTASQPGRPRLECHRIGGKSAARPNGLWRKKRL
jgi:hypothetical protein